MVNVLLADMRKLFTSKAFFIITIAVPTLLILITTISDLAVRLLDIEVTLYSDKLLMDFECRYSAIIIAVIATFFVGQELRNGVIRNRLVCGCSRIVCFLSSVITAWIATTFMQLVAYVMSFVFGKVLGESYLDNMYTLKNMALWICASFAVAIFSVLIVYICGESNASYVASGAIAVILYFVINRVNDKLFPQDGIVKITGTKLTIYQGISKYFAFSYLSLPRTYEIRVYVIGCLAMAILSLVIGCVVFSRKELK